MKSAALTFYLPLTRHTGKHNTGRGLSVKHEQGGFRICRQDLQDKVQN